MQYPNNINPIFWAFLIDEGPQETPVLTNIEFTVYVRKQMDAYFRLHPQEFLTTHTGRPSRHAGVANIERFHQWILDQERAVCGGVYDRALAYCLTHDLFAKEEA